MNFRTTPCPSVNDGSPPTTSEWNEFELKQTGPARRSRAAKAGATRGPAPLPALTPEQIEKSAASLYRVVSLMIEALDLEAWDGRWGNRLMQAHVSARNAVEHASKWTQPEAVAASDSAIVHAESDPQRESATTAVEASPNNPTPGV